jgi:hypothetical protein
VAPAGLRAGRLNSDCPPLPGGPLIDFRAPAHWDFAKKKDERDMLHSIGDGHRQLIVVGDRVLIRPEQPDARTQVGLYLPETVLEKEKIQAGRIVAVGPGSRCRT